MCGFVYFMTNNHNSVLYIGVSSDLERRVFEHKNDIDKSSFTYKHNCHKLVYYEAFGDMRYAIEREKQLKNWKREWKDALVAMENPDWQDLSITWGDWSS